jgi:hypothetical protein
MTGALAKRRLRSSTAVGALLSSGSLSGGVAKSESIYVAASIALLAGLTVGFIDGDAATGALLKRLDPALYLVRPLSAIATFRDEMFATFDIVMLDFGAGKLGDGDVLMTALPLFQYAGRTNSGMMISQIPNKAGIVEDMTKIATLFDPVAQLHLVRHNVDGSNNFAPIDPRLLALPAHDVPQLDPNLADLWRSRKILPADFTLQPPPGYERAAASVAQHLLAVATSNDFAWWLGAEAAIPKLQLAAVNAPRFIPPVASALLTNDVIDAYDRYYQMYIDLHTIDPNDSVVALTQFQRYWRAYAELVGG